MARGEALMLLTKWACLALRFWLSWNPCSLLLTAGSTAAQPTVRRSRGCLWPGEAGGCPLPQTEPVILWPMKVACSLVIEGRLLRYEGSDQFQYPCSLSCHYRYPKGDVPDKQHLSTSLGFGASILLPSTKHFRVLMVERQKQQMWRLFGRYFWWLQPALLKAAQALHGPWLCRYGCGEPLLCVIPACTPSSN